MTRRSGSWLMMLATPVLRSAWSSTSRTVAFFTSTAASASNVHLRRQIRGLPRQHDLRPAARRRDDRERGTNALGPLLHARHPETTGRLLACDAAPIVGNR